MWEIGQVGANDKTRPQPTQDTQSHRTIVVYADGRTHETKKKRGIVGGGQFSIKGEFETWLPTSMYRPDRVRGIREKYVDALY